MAGGRDGACDRLFAYGTLMDGFCRRGLLGPAVSEGAARVRGALHDFGEYPGLVLDDAGWVAGELYRLPDLPARLAAIDVAEGYDPANPGSSLYVRRRATVETGGAATPEAWLYVYNGPPGRGPRIPSGDWRAHVLARDPVSR